MDTTPTDTRSASRPLWCLVSDRQRLAGSSPTAVPALVTLVGAAARAGVHLIQIRERDLAAGALCAVVRACVDAVKGSGARVVVNDRIDVALAAGADGVHLRGDGPPASRVRRMVRAGFLIGRSVHTVPEAREAAADRAVDYLLAGTVFPTASKPGRGDVLGLEGLRAIVASVDVPVLAIGGLDVASAAGVAGAGAAGMAAIGLFCGGPASDVELTRTIAALRRAFDSSRRVP